MWDSMYGGIGAGRLALAALAGAFGICSAMCCAAADGADGDVPAWPAESRLTRPWAYNWWPGSAVDEENLARELRRYRDGGLGGIHVVPIYGAKGAESRYIPYLSKQWMQMLAYAIREAERLDLGLDMTTGTGWCFGGPDITPELAGIKVRVTDGGFETAPAAPRVKRAAPGGEGFMLNPFYGRAMEVYLERFSRAFADKAQPRPRAMYHDSFEYSGPNWSPDFPAAFAMRRGYRIEEEREAFAGKADPDRVARVRCDYRETLSDMMVENVFGRWAEWCRSNGMLTRNQAHGSPGNLLDLYALADIPETEMFGRGTRDPLKSAFDARFGEGDRNPLVSKLASSAAHTAGHRLTSSETCTWMAEHFCETLEEAKCFVDRVFMSGVNHVFYHGCVYSPDDAAWPGWLFYASTEMNPRNPLWRAVPALNAYVSRCQAVLQSGRPDNDILLYWPIHDTWAADKTFMMTVHNRGWLESEPLGRAAKRLWAQGYAFDYVSDRLLKGLDPGADGLRGTDGALWRAIVVPACQRMPADTLAAIMRAAAAGATVIFENRLPEDVPGLGKLEARRAAFKAALAPLLPPPAAGGGVTNAPPAAAALTIAKASYGAGDVWIDVTETVRSYVRDDRLSLRVDVPRPFPDPLVGTKKTLQVEFAYGTQTGRKAAIDRGTLTIGPEDLAPALREVNVGHGRVLIGGLADALAAADVRREPMVEHAETHFVRRRLPNGEGTYYFIVNQGTQPIDGWLPLATAAHSVVVMDPLSGAIGWGEVRTAATGCEVRVAIAPGHSIVLRMFAARERGREHWRGTEPAGTDGAVAVSGPWQVTFVEGGPALPEPFEQAELSSWASNGDPEAERFAGTAEYRTTFDMPDPAGARILELGEVCHAARITLNDRELGTLIMHPYRLRIPDGLLKATGNALTVQVTNLAANRIRDLDRRGVQWQIFHDINFVNIGYKHFDASQWPVFASGLLGPVRVLPARE